MKKVWVMMLATLMVSSTMMAGNVKKSTTLPIVGEVVKASHPMIQYVGRVSFAKNPDVASFNYPGTTIEASFQGSSLKMLCRPKTGYFMAQIDGCEPFKVGFFISKCLWRIEIESLIQKYTCVFTYMESSLFIIHYSGKYHPFASVFFLTAHNKELSFSHVCQIRAFTHIPPIHGRIQHIAFPLPFFQIIRNK